MEFIALAVNAESQARFSNLSAYTPINTQSDEMVNAEMRPHLSTAHSDQQISMSLEYWADNGSDISKQWNDFVLQ